MAVAAAVMFLALLTAPPALRARISDEALSLAGRAALAVAVVVHLLPGLPHDFGHLALIAVAVVVAARGSAYVAVRTLRTWGWGLEPTAVLGTGPAAVELAMALQNRPEEGLTPVGFIDAADDRDLPLPILGRADEVERIAKRHAFRHIVVAVGGKAEHALVPVEVRRPGAHGRPYLRFVKPLLDRLLGTVLLVFALPLLAGLALAVRIQLGSPVLIRQQRAGLGGAPFKMYKFRTMEPDRRDRQVAFNGQDRRRSHKRPDDPRHTDLGRVLRALSLDELPQLLNVVKGDMSLVGPRPELVDVVARYEPWQHERHAVRPGLTGLWQVTARGTEMHRHTDIDLTYIRRASFVTDCRILLRTVPALLGRNNRGA